MHTRTKERVLQWITGSDTSFLVGAGCSRCAGKPLIGDLTKNVLSKVDSQIGIQFDALRTTSMRAPTIEDLINYLTRYRSILQTLKDTSSHPFPPTWADDALQAIKNEVVNQIADDWVHSAVHARFLRRVAGNRPGAGRDIFSLNYDTVIEATLDHLRYHYTDGFRGARRAWFDPTVFDELPVCTPSFKIHKLHGSVNWLREDTGHVRRSVVRTAADVTEAVVVYPSEQKYLQTQFGVYETLIGRFRSRLRAPSVNNCLVTLGYSFNDEHINEAIIDAINAPGSNLTVIAFVGPDDNTAGQTEQFRTIEARCDSRFNAFVGDFLCIGGALDSSESQALLDANLWRFENLVDYIAGSEA